MSLTPEPVNWLPRIFEWCVEVRMMYVMHARQWTNAFSNVCSSRAQLTAHSCVLTSGSTSLVRHAPRNLRQPARCWRRMTWVTWWVAKGVVSYDWKSPWTQGRFWLLGGWLMDGWIENPSRGRGVYIIGILAPSDSIFGHYLSAHPCLCTSDRSRI